MLSYIYGDNMTKQTRPRFDPEFKVEVAQLLLDQGYLVKEAAQAMGVGLSNLDKWARKLKNKRNWQLTPGNPITPEQRDIAELKKCIKQLETEKEILKKLQCPTPWTVCASQTAQGNSQGQGFMPNLQYLSKKF